MNIKSHVKEKWGKAGKPEWDFQKTKKVVIEADDYFRKIGENPAKRLRINIDKGKSKYISDWIYGSHFEWINPR